MASAPSTNSWLKAQRKGDLQSLAEKLNLKMYVKYFISCLLRRSNGTHRLRASSRRANPSRPREPTNPPASLRVAMPFHAMLDLPSH
jgi:hypothetical protein